MQLVSPRGPLPPNYGACMSIFKYLPKVFLITIESPIGAGELHIRPDDYMQVKCQKNEVYEAFAGDNVSVEFNEEKEIVAAKKVQLTMPGEYLK